MKTICVKNAEKLQGRVWIQGSKNTILPVVAASLLGDGVSYIHNCPMIDDVEVMCRLLACLNVTTTLENHVLKIDVTNARYAKLPCELTTKLRSSVLLLAPMLAKWGKAQLGVPGGCNIGLRPIDIHLKGLQKMNVVIHENEYILKGETRRLEGTAIQLRFPSVGATENLLMAAVTASGNTILRGVAKEPEIVELCHYLNAMGADIEGVGTDVLIIRGVAALHSCDYCNVYDRIVAGTYLLAAAAIPSDIRLYGITDIAYMKNMIRTATDLGVNVIKMDQCLWVRSCASLQGGDFMTGVYPDFPTDLLPVLIAVLTKARKNSTIKEGIFENRFGILAELEKLGATFLVEDDCVQIEGTRHLNGNCVCATDLRQGAALVVAGLLSQGQTNINNISYIARGYEDIVRDLKNLGAKIDYV